MKKFSKYFTIFFAFYNLFVVVIAAFNLFNFSNISLRILLGMEAFQVAMYKFCDAMQEDTTVPHSGPDSTSSAAEPTMKIVKVNAPIITLRHVTREYLETYNDFEHEIRASMARELGEELMENGSIKFSKQEDRDNNYVTTIAEIKVVKENNNEIL